MARFFVTGGGGGTLLPSAQGTSLEGGARGILPRKVLIWGFQNTIFSTCHEICHRKIDLEHKNGKQLEVIIIKITESKENNSATCCGEKILLQRQRFSQNFSSTHEEICRCNVSSQHFAATCRRTCTHGVICRRDLLLQLVA